MYFNFWYCNPISKANQGHKLKFSCPKWTFCHMLEHSKLYSSPFSPAQHNCWERGESQHVAHLLGTGNYFFLKVNEGNYKNWGEGNHLWTCSNYLEFFPDFLLLQNCEFLASKGPFWGEKTKIQTTLRVVHSPVVEKLPVVDKTLPPDHFYLAKAPSSGQFPVVDKKFWDTACKTLKSQHFFEIFWTFSCKEQNIL